MRKFKVLIIVFSFLILAFALFGCKKDPVVEKMVISSPDDVVYESSQINTTGGKVYLFMSDGAIKTEAFTSVDREVTSLGENKGSVVTITENYGAHSSQYKVFIKESESASNDGSVLFYSVQFTESVMQHNLGDYFESNIKNNQDIKVLAITNRGEEIVIARKDINIVLANKAQYESVYLNGGYSNISIKVADTIALNIPIRIIGGEKPLHTQNAGWFDYILVIPVGFLLSIFSFGEYFWLGIVLTTILVRTLLWPVYASSNSMQFKMTLAQPEIDKLQRKYQGRTDPEARQRMQMETTKIYRKYKINFWGCLFMFLQLPVFTAMWQAMRRIVVAGGIFANDVSNTKFLWFDLAGGMSEWSIATVILCLLVGGTMVLQTFLTSRKPKYLKQTTTHNKSVDDKQAQTQKTMKIMQYGMVVMMVFVAFTSNHAMSLYWIIGNTFSLGQAMLTRYLNKVKYEKHRENQVLGGH